jgi:hypothetical protein
MINFHRAQNEPNDLQSRLILQERLRQARIGFNFAIATTSVAGLIIVAGVILLFSEKISIGIFTAGAGIMTGACGTKMAIDANDRLDKLANAQAKANGER